MADSKMKRARESAWAEHVATLDHSPAVAPVGHFTAGWIAALRAINQERLDNPGVGADVIVAVYAAHYEGKSV